MTTKAQRVAAKEKAAWVAWLTRYGAGNFYDAFMRTAQDAESRCVYCREPIFLDIREGGGVADWYSEGGDYGCGDAPGTDSEGTAGHEPRRNENAT